mgnify:CR=1 FL=1|tara:strand:- start:3602 stop:4426 length:825 start_codon:yes stop_codon:yes gene_type:complete
MQICAITGSSGVLGKKIKKLLPFKFYEFKGDITRHKEVNKWINNKNFDLLIHLAAKVPTKEVEQKYQYSLKVNHLGTKNIVKALKSKINKPKWVFFSSTSHVYGLNNKNVKIKETSKLYPSSKYGFTKRKAELEIIKLKKYKINFCIGRIFSFTDCKQKTPYVIPSIINKIKNSKKKDVTLRNINHFRDFISTTSICKIIKRLYKTKSSGIFNIGSGQATNIKQIAKLIGKKYKKKIIFEDNKIASYLISNNKKILKKGIKFKKFYNNLNFLYN